MLRTEMKRTLRTRATALAACALAACAIAWGGDAHAQTASPSFAQVMEQLQRQEHTLDAQQRQLYQQQEQLTQQRQLIEQQRRQLEAMSGAVSDGALNDMRGAGLPGPMVYRELAADEPISTFRRAYSTIVSENSGGGGAAPVSTADSTPPQGPVGEAPTQEEPAAQVEALPEGSTALSGRGKLTLESSIEYSRSSNNRLVFRGVEIVTGIQIGVIEASDSARDTIAGSLAARYALTDRLEIEGRVPYIYRSDRVTTLAQNDEQQTETFELSGSNVGDAEVSARYQLNRGRNGLPMFVVGGRIKSDTGKGPFDLARDAAGISTELATGSGFWGVQGSISALYPSDPVVLYGSLSYLHNVARDVNVDLGGVHVGEVDPGDSIGAGFGFGFSLNPRFSYSLGYSHSYVMETTTQLNDTVQRSTALQVGTLQLGMSFRVNEDLTVSTGVDVGVTEDAPDVRISLRTPFRF
jgi:hypothetical protein